MKAITIVSMVVFSLISVLSCGQKNTTSPIPLEAKLSMVFVDNAAAGEYSAGLAITKGSIKVNDTLYATRRELTIPLVVQIITVNDENVKSIGTTENAFVVFKAVGDGSKFDYDFTLSNIRPKGTSTTTANASSVSGDYQDRAANCVGDPKLKVSLNGSQWSVEMLDEDRLLYEKGLSYVNCESGYLQLAMHGCSGDDDRQLLISVCGFSGKTGLVNNDNVNYVFSGKKGTSESDEVKMGDLFSPKKAQMKLEVTKYERLSATTARISIRFYGKIPSSLTYAKEVTFEESVLNDVEVKIFSEAY